MKKTVSCVLIFALIMSVFLGFTVSADGGINVTIDGETQTYDVMPVNISGRVLVPLRGIFEKLGAEIQWRDDIKTVYANKGAKKVVVTIDSTYARIDGQPVNMDVPATIIEGRTMVPVRFVSEAMGEDVAWDDATKTVIITHNKNAGLKRLISDFHRPVPTEFTKSNKLDDLIYYETNTSDPAKVYEEVMKKATPVEMFNVADLENGEFSTNGYATKEITVDEEGNKIFKINVTKKSDDPAKCIYKCEKTIESMLHNGDVCMLKLTLRTVDGGNDQGLGKICVQVENPERYTKDIYREFESAGQWKTYYFSYRPKMKTGGNGQVGLRVPYNVQTIEIKEFSLLNFGSQVVYEEMPKFTMDTSSLSEDAEWRKQALEDIEKHRKGDFNVVVLDKDGNPVKDAEVELDMFEHEFEFGSAFTTGLSDNEKYGQVASSVFNAGVSENAMKWSPYERGANVKAMKILGALDKYGIKYYRGHTLVWQIPVTGINARMVPEDAVEMANNKQTDALRTRINTFIETMMTDFKGKLTEWDVTNEVVNNKQLETNNGGAQLRKEWFDVARKTEPGVDLFYNEGTLYIEKYDGNKAKQFFDILDEMKELNFDYDGIGLQSHHDMAEEDMEEIIKAFEKIATYGKEVKITEYSCSNSDPELQANFTRDFFIAAFSRPYITGIIMWGFYGGNYYAKYAPMYDEDWNLNKCGEIIVDLMYNKWWTRDAKANTDAEGKATINGFYGDYDVTVKANGQEKKVSVAFGKGYENTLYITLD